MNYYKMLKPAAILLALLAALSTNAQVIDVHLRPEVQAPTIGQLESFALAVNAEWPADLEPTEGWKPIFYRGVFEVFVSNNDISKDLTPKPGSNYLLSPDKKATVLSTATKDDKTDLISVDPRYSKLNIETILVAYIKDEVQLIEEPTVPEPPANVEIEVEESVPAPAPATPDTVQVETTQPTPPAMQEVSTPPATTTQSENPMRRFQGVLQTCNIVEKSKTSCPYKLLDSNGKTLGFLDVKNLPEFIIIKDYIGNKVSIAGQIYSIESSNNLRIVASSLKKAN
ncbi:hypothetical protein MLD52_11780 [Puniceicoccaceae bacterium K14]|nr:hypothetical protein [Puniceicoccaceae bacterium K14]